MHHHSTKNDLSDTLSPQESRDRLAIRELIDRYAHCADRRLTEEQLALFTPNVHFLVHMQGDKQPATQELHRREDLRPVFEGMKAYTHTMHFNGQSTVNITKDGRTARNESYCIAHHVTEKEGKRSLFVAYLRYEDVLEKQEDGTWLFAERKLLLDFSENRQLE